MRARAHGDPLLAAEALHVPPGHHRALAATPLLGRCELTAVLNPTPTRGLMQHPCRRLLDMAAAEGVLPRKARLYGAACEILEAATGSQPEEALTTLSWLLAQCAPRRLRSEISLLLALHESEPPSPPIALLAAAMDALTTAHDAEADAAQSLPIAGASVSRETASVPSTTACEAGELPAAVVLCELRAALIHRDALLPPLRHAFAEAFDRFGVAALALRAAARRSRQLAEGLAQLARAPSAHAPLVAPAAAKGPVLVAPADENAFVCALCLEPELLARAARAHGLLLAAATAPDAARFRDILGALVPGLVCAQAAALVELLQALLSLHLRACPTPVSPGPLGPPPVQAGELATSFLQPHSMCHVAVRDTLRELPQVHGHPIA
jgi:hypothetical protein